MWERKGFGLLLVLLFCLSSGLYSDEGNLTEQEEDQLITICETCFEENENLMRLLEEEMSDHAETRSLYVEERNDKLRVQELLNEAETQNESLIGSRNLWRSVSVVGIVATGVLGTILVMLGN